jgi:hypothetical protein
LKSKTEDSNLNISYKQINNVVIGTKLVEQNFKLSDTNVKLSDYIDFDAIKVQLAAGEGKK